MGKIQKEAWHDYLYWVRARLRLPVQNNVALERIEAAGDLLAAQVIDQGTTRTIFTRKIVLAMGIEASGRWWMPEHIAALPEKYRAHSSDAIDFSKLKGKRVAVLGAGASAFDDAATALEAGAAQVALFCRRTHLQRVQPYRAISYPGFLRYFGDLDDALRWCFMDHVLTVREALPPETWRRVTKHHNFSLHTGSPWERAAIADDSVRITTPLGEHQFDFLICGTGFELNINDRRELSGFTDHIATWGDRFCPPANAQNPRLANFPFLGSGQELLEKTPACAPHLRHIRVYDFGATMSFGPSGASINAMKYAAPRIAGAICRDLFRADIEHHWQTLAAYDTPEFPLTFARDE